MLSQWLKSNERNVDALPIKIMPTHSVNTPICGYCNKYGQYVGRHKHVYQRCLRANDRFARAMHPNKSCQFVYIYTGVHCLTQNVKSPLRMQDKTSTQHSSVQDVNTAL